MKEKMRDMMDRIVKNGRYVFPFIVLIAAAITVEIALEAGKVHRDELDQIVGSVGTQESETSTSVMESSEEDSPLIINEDQDIQSLVATYYNAVAMGDEEVLNRVCDKVEEKDMLRFLETAKYIDHYPVLDIYTKPGFSEGDTVAYVYFKVIFKGKEAEYPGYQRLYISTAEDGSKFIKRSNSTNEVNEYLEKVSAAPDVVELINRVEVEYNNLMAEQPDLLIYLKDLNEEVNLVVGVELAKQEGENASEPSGSETEPGEEGSEETPSEPVQETVYAVASTTVNVRASDSEKSNKIGSLAGGDTIQVLEQLVNGWSKVKYENQEGYIMSKYLVLQEKSSESAPIGTVEATDTLNVRAQASVNSERLGTLFKGGKADLLSDEGGWCKIIFNGQIAFVKSEYVKITLS